MIVFVAMPVATEPVQNGLNFVCGTKVPSQAMPTKLHNDADVLTQVGPWYGNRDSITSRGFELC